MRNSVVNRTVFALAAAAIMLFAAAGPAEAADIVHPDDVIAQDNMCIGIACVDGEDFGDDILRLKENVLRVHFEDFSTATGFPTNDWRFIINDISNGGDEYFALEDTTAGRTVFQIEAGARSNALYVDSSGDVGLGTSIPDQELHIRSGDTPTIRLEQDASSWDPQTWDVGGNDLNFFIFDVTSDKVPFKIYPNAPTYSFVIQETTGDIGLGTHYPQAPLDVYAGTDPVGTGNAVIRLAKDGDLAFQLNDTANSGFWNFAVANSESEFRISRSGTGTQELILDTSGNLTITGSLTTAGGTIPDYVFDPGYPLMPLDRLAAFIEEEKHLPRIPSAEEMKEGVNMSRLQLQLLEKVEELTLYILAQEKTVLAQEKTIDSQKEAILHQGEAILQLQSRLEAMEMRELQ
ncbi:hypothetical protein N9903_00150 [bacterium]|nr:hypothetical protein [bacterium]